MPDETSAEPAPAHLPAEIDTSVPNPARMYDYGLGGSHNFAADREAAERARAAMPGAFDAARGNRDFLGRAVRFCVAEGVDQFLDLGSGIPTVGNVHTVAQSVDPAARVAYVDNEPVAVEMSRTVLADVPFLGGSHNFAADRVAGDRACAAMPGLVDAARGNRDFLRRAVRHCQSEGIDQFLDLGSGIPTVGNVHEVARATDPGARVAYVDLEAVAVATSRSVLEDDPLSTITAADLRDVDAVLSAPGVAGHLDLTRPVALLTVAVLHFAADSDRPAELMARYRERLAAGSLHVPAHATSDFDPQGVGRVVAAYRSTANPFSMRTRAEVEALMAGTDILTPGGGWRSATGVPAPMPCPSGAGTTTARWAASSGDDPVTPG